MKTLPDSPDLDHLRQQAKDLLAGLRAADPALAECFDLGAVTSDMRSLARPDEMGRRWSLETARGRWAVRTMDTWWPIVHPDTDVALQEAAATAGVLLPRPVRSRAGLVVDQVGGHEWRVNAWAHSGPPLAAPAGPDVTRAVGELLAKLHGLALPVDRISPWHHTRFSDLTWPELAAKARAAGASWAAELTEAAPTLVALGDIGAGAPDPAPVLSHNALIPGNVGRGRDGLLVTGWEHAGGQPPAWELATALVDWAVEPGGDVNVAGARALVDGYRATAGGLPPLDLASFLGAVTAHGNHACGQLEYALAAYGEDRRYADRNMRHLLSHLPTPAVLKRLLDVAC